MVTTADRLVGRERELAELDAALIEVAAGRGRFFIIEGPSGIGKTRLVQEFCSIVRERGTLILRSRSSSAPGAPAYWPWVQIIRACLSAIAGRDFYSKIQPALNHIGEVLPDACGAIVEGRQSFTPVQLDPEQIRFRLFDSIHLLLKAASELKPIVLVFEDVGAADRASLSLLQFLAYELYELRILVVATYRGSDLRKSRALANAIGDLARDATVLVLDGLSEAEVARLLEQNGGDSSIAPAIQRATGGNPFLVTSVLKTFNPEIARASARPKSAGLLAAVLEARFAPLSPDGRRMLTFAAVMGEQFDIAVVELAMGISALDMGEILAEMNDAGLLVQARETRVNLWRFVHSLVRDAVYDSVGPTECANIHKQIADAIENVYAEDIDSHLSDLAHHCSLGSEAGTASRAIQYGERAAQRAANIGAFEEAARWYRTALGAMKASRATDQQRECEILLAMGDAQKCNGDYEDARETFSVAADLATRINDPELLSRAALGYPGLEWSAAAVSEQKAVSLLERALDAVPRQAEKWRAMLMARLSAELYQRPGANRRREVLARTAVAIGRRINDPATLLTILGNRDLILSGPDALGERLANAEEITRVAEVTGSHLGRYMGFHSRMVYFRHVGNLVRAEAEAQAMELIANVTRLPVCTWGARCFAAARALQDGHFEQGERLARECASFAQRIRSAEASDLFWPALMPALHEQDRLAELADAAIESIGRRPEVIAFRAFEALINLAQEEIGAARVAFDMLTADTLTSIPHDNMFLACVCALAELCARLNETEKTGEILRVLRPYAELVAIFGPIGSFGSVARYLGLLASSAGDFSEAQEYFEKALQLNRSIKSVVYLGYTQCDYADMLLRRGSLHDREQAHRLISLATDIAEHRGMKALARRLDSLRNEIQRRVTASAGQAADGYDAAISSSEKCEPRAVSAAGLSTGAGIALDSHTIPDPGSAIFRREGDYWTITYAGELFRVRHANGLACLAYLLGHPESEVHSVNLAAHMQRLSRDTITPSPDLEIIGDPNGTVNILTKAEYQRRSEELRKELGQARTMNDIGRVEIVEREIHALTSDMARAIGFDPRSRQSTCASERARLNVTKAIRAVLRKIAEHNAKLGRHLHATIRTGTFCSYRPDPASQIEWTIN